MHLSMKSDESPTTGKVLCYETFYETPERLKMFFNIFLLYYFFSNFSHSFSVWQQNDHRSFNVCETFPNI